MIFFEISEFFYERYLYWDFYCISDIKNFIGYQNFSNIGYPDIFIGTFVKEGGSEVKWDLLGVELLHYKLQSLW